MALLALAICYSMPEKDELQVLGQLTVETVKTFIPLVPRANRPSGPSLLPEDTTRAHVQAIWFDGSVKECARAKKGSRLHDGLVTALSATDNYKRGSTGGQTYLWPWRCMLLQLYDFTGLSHYVFQLMVARPSK